MTNLELAVAILAKHREARMWSDDAVAADMLAELSIDPAGIVKMTEAEVIAAETAAKDAADKAAAARAAFTPDPTPDMQHANEPAPVAEPMAVAFDDTHHEEIAPAPVDDHHEAQDASHG